MKISLNWLKQYVDINLTANQLAEKLTNAGLEVSSLKKIDKDTVLEIEITSNRPDWLSYMGIAREVAALTGIKQINLPRALPLKAKASINKPFLIQIQDKRGCMRYVGRLIRNVKIIDSPLWIKTALTAIGSRIINNAADITNYCLYETGQPLHAFDFDKLEGSKIIVRWAKKSESIITIDGVERKLDETILVIADEKKPVAIAGIMGGLDTEVSNQTKNILLESAFFDPVTIRRAARKLGLATESNYRFERKVDPYNVLYASCRAAYLMKDIAQADIKEPFIDINYIKSDTKKVQLNLSNIEKLIGLKVSVTKIKAILESLGFSVSSTMNIMRVTVPSFRSDVNCEEDLIEEIARIIGFNNIEAVMPPIKAHIDPACSDQYMAKSKLRTILTGQGLDEIVTFSLISTRCLNQAMISDDHCAKVINPLSIEQEVLRNSLVPGILKVINTNQNRKIKNLRLFEIGNTYKNNKNKFSEAEMLSIAISGQAYQNWQDNSRKINFYDLKGIVEVLLESFEINEFNLIRQKREYFDQDQSVIIKVAGIEVAEMGKLKKQVLKNFDISEDVYMANINIALLTTQKKISFRYVPVPKYPSVVRDIAIVLKQEIPAQAALDIIQQTGAALAVKTELFDFYQGDQIPADCKSLAFSIEYQSKDTTLTEEQVNSIHGKIQRELLDRLNATLR
ncbi:MAG: phenylalanine--tRNA ligase subunit beta [Candidatus Omnitrophota bacterium]